MDNRKKRKELVPGVKYRGYGYLNEFGEFEFVPENTGSRQGRKKLLKQGERFTVSTTNAHVVIHMLIGRESEKLKLAKEFMQVVNDVLVVLRDYEV